MARKSTRKKQSQRRVYTEELKAEAVQMLFDGHSAQSVVENLGLSGTNILYRWKVKLLQQRGPAAAALEQRVAQLEEELRRVERDVFHEHRRRYGARRIVAELADRELPTSRRRVRRLMKEMDLVAIQPRLFKPQTTDSCQMLGYNDNLLTDAPPPESINRVWVADITYVPLIGGTFLYLAMLMDLFSRRIAHKELPAYIRYYNTRRRHSSLGNLTPEAFEAQTQERSELCRESTSLCCVRKCRCRPC